MRKQYIIRDREAGNIIEACGSLNDARKLLSSYEKQDVEDGIYVEDFYEIITMPTLEIIKINREYTTLTIQEIESRVLSSPARTILLNFSNTFRIDSAGIGSLVKLQNKLKDKEIILYNMNQEIIEIFEITELYEFFNIKNNGV